MPEAGLFSFGEVVTDWDMAGDRGGVLLALYDVVIAVLEVCLCLKLQLGKHLGSDRRKPIFIFSTF